MLAKMKEVDLEEPLIQLRDPPQPNHDDQDQDQVVSEPDAESEIFAEPEMFNDLDADRAEFNEDIKKTFFTQVEDDDVPICHPVGEPAPKKVKVNKNSKDYLAKSLLGQTGTRVVVLDDLNDAELLKKAKKRREAKEAKAQRDGTTPGQGATAAEGATVSTDETEEE